MRSASFLDLVLLLALVFVLAACNTPSANTLPASQPTSASSQAEGTVATSGGWFGAEEAVTLAYAALSAAWKTTAK